MYALLCLTYTTRLAYYQGERNLFRILSSWDGLKYAVIGLIDVEANFLVVKSYAYTSVTSVQVMCFFLAFCFLVGHLYSLFHPSLKFNLNHLYQRVKQGCQTLPILHKITCNKFKRITYFLEIEFARCLLLGTLNCIPEAK